MKARGQQGVQAAAAVASHRTRQRRGPLNGLRGGLSLLLCSLWMACATTAPAEAATPTPQPAYLATHLRTNPVYVTDQLPREVPHSTAPAFAKLAERTGVPTYVLVLPDQQGGTGLLGAVHDRLGRDGLFVLVDDMGVADAQAFGVRVPAEDAEDVALYELPYDAGPLLSFQRFTEVIAQGSAKAAKRADAAHEKYAGDAYDSGEDPPNLYITSTDRDNQSFLTGILLVGVPVLILLLVPFVRRRLPGGAEKRPWAARVLAPALALLTAAAIALAASLTFDQTKSSASPAPTAADMSARTDRVAAGLERDAVYTDPESPRVLDAAQRDRLHQQIVKFAHARGSVYVALVPQLYEDESAGDADVFAASVHDKLRRDGVYVVADPLGGDIDVFNYGLRLDNNRLLFDLPDSIRYGDDAADASADHHLGPRLDQLMTFLFESPRTDEASSSGSGRTADPVDDNTLHSLFAGDFWPGLAMGALAGLLVFGVVAAVTAIVAGVRRRHGTSLAPSTSRPFEAPTEPSLSYLRRTARDELGALGQEFGDTSSEATAYIRAWDCFDAAMLLVDGDIEIDGPGDAEGSPATLVAVIVLARAGRAALTGDTYDSCCGLNPLHGPAAGPHDVRLSSESGGARRRRGWIPVCDRCRDTAVVDPGDVHTLRLTLPGQGPDRVPYEDVDSPLPAARRGIPQLIAEVREYVSVQ